MDHSFRLLYGNYGAGSYEEASKFHASDDVYGSLRCRGSKKKNYVCPKCGNGYTVVKSLTRHLRYECGVAPRFKCPYCGTRSKQRAHVNEHIRRKHSGQRIYIIDSPWWPALRNGCSPSSTSSSSTFFRFSFSRMSTFSFHALTVNERLVTKV